MTLEEAQKEVDKWIKTYVLLCIANQTGVDITKAFRESLEKKTKRDNKRHINNPKLNDHGRE